MTLEEWISDLEGENRRYSLEIDFYKNHLASDDVKNSRMYWIKQNQEKIDLLKELQSYREKYQKEGE